MSKEVHLTKSKIQLVLCGLVLVLICGVAWNLKAVIQLKEEMVNIQADINKQSSYLSRAIGKYIPVEMPEKWVSELEELEKQIANESKWPNSIQAASEFYKKTKSLIEALPSWAESDFISRVNPVRWYAMAFSALYPVELDFYQQLDSLEFIKSNVQEDTPDKIIKFLESESDKVRNEIYNSDKMELLQQAKEYLNQPVVENDNLESMSEVLVLLETYEYNDDEFDTTIKPFRTKLTHDLQNAYVQSQVDTLTNKKENLIKIKSKEPSLYEAGLGLLIGEIRTSRMSLALNGIESPSLDKLDEDISNEIETRQSKKLNIQLDAEDAAFREYQKFALEQIKQFDMRFKDREDICETVLADIQQDNRDKTYADLPRTNDILTKTEYKVNERWYWFDGEQYKLGDDDVDLNVMLKHRICSDAMVSHLLIINQSVLAAPVQKRYSRAFMKGWDYLEGTEDQTHVAMSVITTKQKALVDFIKKDIVE